MLEENLNDKYYLLKKDSNPNSLFASFNIFKTMVRGKDDLGQRPPYPIIINDPTFSEVLTNMNKSDVFLGLCFLPLGFLGSIYVTRPSTLIPLKFSATRFMMYWHSLLGLYMAMNCSFYRLTGKLDNGLRWRQKEMIYSKYDFTLDFERQTIFKHFRIRVD